MEDMKMTEETPGNVTRRNFIKGVIAAGAAVSSASYLFRTQRVWARRRRRRAASNGWSR